MVPAFALLVGNPAKQIGWVGEYGHRLTFNEKGYAICPESQQEYLLLNNRVSRIK
jgi:UDP-2-acetamido-3-amino-2,3-dideoxy-glucuronate N-acetyltransferase